MNMTEQCKYQCRCSQALSGFRGICIFIFVLGMFALVSTPPALAQDAPPQRPTVPNAQPDFKPLEKIADEQKQPQARTTTATMTKSPIEALWKSAIPGWGQLYVESYWKAPIFFGGAAYCVGGAIVQGIAYTKSDSLFNANRSSFYLRQREFYRDTRDAFIIAAAAVWAIAAVDAFVGAHLYDFDVSDEIPKSEQKTSLHPAPLEPAPLRITPYLDPINVRIGIVARW